MGLKNIFKMTKTDRYTQDGRDELAKLQETEDVTYKPGDISQKTGLQKQPDGSWAPPKSNGVIAQQKQKMESEKYEAARRDAQVPSKKTEVNTPGLRKDVQEAIKRSSPEEIKAYIKELRTPGSRMSRYFDNPDLLANVYEDELNKITESKHAAESMSKTNTAESTFETIKGIYPKAYTDMHSGSLNELGSIGKARAIEKDANGNDRDVKFEYIRNDTRNLSNGQTENGVSLKVMGENIFIPKGADAQRYLKNIIDWKMNKDIYEEKGNYKEKAVDYIKTRAMDDTKMQSSIDYKKNWYKENNNPSTEEIERQIKKYETLLDPNNKKDSHVTEVESNYLSLLAYQKLLEEKKKGTGDAAPRELTGDCKIKIRQTQDVKYKTGDISQKTGLQKQPDGSWAPPKKGGAGAKKAEGAPSHSGMNAEQYDKKLRQEGWKQTGEYSKNAAGHNVGYFEKNGKRIQVVENSEGRIAGVDEVKPKTEVKPGSKPGNFPGWEETRMASGKIYDLKSQGKRIIEQYDPETETKTFKLRDLNNSRSPDKEFKSLEEAKSAATDSAPRILTGDTKIRIRK